MAAALPRLIWEKIGELDERFTGCGGEGAD